jgi:hypothetical protein
MDANEFKSRLVELEREFDSDAINIGSHRLESCERCSNCVFCSSCDRCYRCSYCEGCSASTNLTHCIGCNASHHLSNCVECNACTSSAFLVLCRDLSECNYCFGCVGLVREDFHILNERYSRTEYFEQTARLFKALRVPRP